MRQKSCDVSEIRLCYLEIRLEESRVLYVFPFLSSLGIGFKFFTFIT